MLAIVGYAVVAAFIILIMTKKMSAVVALVVVPLIAGLLLGKGAELGDSVIDGIVSLAPTAALLTFAILYFSVMIDAGLFEPVVRLALRISGTNPVKITVATAVLTLFVALDGDGSSTYLIVIAAFLPIYERVGMSRITLAVIALLGVACMNLTPWGGPVSRAASSLGIDASEIFIPMIPTMIAGALATVFFAFIMGVAERRRIDKATAAIEAPVPSYALSGGGGQHNAEAENAPTGTGHVDHENSAASSPEVSAWHRKTYWVNVLLTVTLIVCLILEVWPLPLLFAAAFALALFINFPHVAEQGKRISDYSSSVIPVVTLILAAGVFVGVLNGTGMIDAMGVALVSVIPESLGPIYGLVVAVTALPLTFVLSNEAYYFGVLPLLAEAGAAHGVSSAEVARAALTGAAVHALSPLVASLYLLVGRLDLNLGDLQRKALPWAFAVSAVMIVVALITGAVPLNQ